MNTRYVNALDLKPTQFCLGLKEVMHKVNLLKLMPKEDLDNYLIHKVTPVVIGPNQGLWLIDHHHHARSLIECGIQEIYINIHADLSHLSLKDFFKHMDVQKWLNPYDENEKKQPASKLPTSLKEMKHDWFRSLAWGVREQGGFLKVDDIPFFEFRWGGFFRKFITQKLIEDDFTLAIQTATKLCQHPEASQLPGFKAN